MSKITTLEDIYVEQLKDLYSAEVQLIQALSEMIQAAYGSDLKGALHHHLDQTYRHAERLEEILQDLAERPNGNRCDALAGLIKEAQKTNAEEAPHEVSDAALIAAAQRIEHYEIAGYSCVRTYATLLEDEEAAGLLQTTLNEEVRADQKLTKVSAKLNLKPEPLTTSLRVISK